MNGEQILSAYARGTLLWVACISVSCGSASSGGDAPLPPAADAGAPDADGTASAPAIPTPPDWDSAAPAARPKTLAPRDSKATSSKPPEAHLPALTARPRNALA